MELSDLRRFAIARSMFAPGSLSQAIERLGFVQADPIRAPARAQDLTLRQRVADYGAGEFERRYAELDVEEDTFVNYGFLPRSEAALLHPRVPRRVWDRSTKRRAARVLAFVRERGEVHPREVDKGLALGSVVNYWGGTSSATTHLLEGMHYRGLLRVVRREAGVRIYALRTPHGIELPPQARARQLLALALHVYAPVPSLTLGKLTSRLRLIAPQLNKELGLALQHMRATFPHAHAAGTNWYWPQGELPAAFEQPDERRVRLLAPFDPLVWDRTRFELFWGWAYRFEAYVPEKKRKFGYYALPLLYGEQVIGWANVAFAAEELGATLDAQFGYVAGKPPREQAFRRELSAELERLQLFLSR